MGKTDLREKAAAFVRSSLGKKLAVLFAAVIGIELFVGNYSALRSMFYQEYDLTESLRLEGAVKMAQADLADGTYYSEGGAFSLTADGLDMEINNLYIGIDLPEDAVVSYTVSLTDGGNQYAYSLPDQHLVEGLPTTCYTNLFPYGKVNSLRIDFQADAGTGFVLEGIRVNVQKPFHIMLPRVLLLLALGGLLTALGEKSRLYAIPFRADSRRQKMATAAAVILLLLFGLFLVLANEACVESIWPHHQQYRQLAEAIRDGHVWVDEQYAAYLTEVKNPYDTIALLAENIPYWADYAYLDGKYYVYFGIVPELLFFLPSLLIAGTAFPNFLAVYLFYAGFVIAVFGLYREAVKRWFPRLPCVAYLLAGAVTVTFGSYIYLAVRPDMYHIPMMGANLFTAAGLWLWLWAVNLGAGEARTLNLESGESGTLSPDAGKGSSSLKKIFKRKRLLFAAGSLSMALVAGCRPQMLLFSVLGLPVLWAEIFHKNKKSTERMKDLLVLGLPYVVVAAGIMYYNALRFGSPLDFGAAYSLTNNDMTKRGINLSRIVYGVYCFFFQPGRIEGTFPFLGSSGLENEYMGRMVSEFLFGGIFVSQAFTWGFLLFGKVKGKLKEKKLYSLVLLSVGMAALIAAFDANGAGVLQRYMADQVFGVAFASMLLLFVLIEKAYGTKGWPYVNLFIRTALVFHAAYAFLMIFACGDSVNLMNYGQKLFYGAAEMFRF